MTILKDADDAVKSDLTDFISSFYTKSLKFHFQFLTEENRRALAFHLTILTLGAEDDQFPVDQFVQHNEIFNGLLDKFLIEANLSETTRYRAFDIIEDLFIEAKQELTMHCHAKFNEALFDLIRAKINKQESPETINQAVDQCFHISNHNHINHAPYRKHHH